MSPAPRIELTDEQLEALFEFVPHWHATIVGPFGTRVTVDYMLRKTVREIAELMFDYAREVDEVSNREHDPDQWMLVSATTCNCN